MDEIEKLDKPKSEIVNEALKQYISKKTDVEACIQPCIRKNSEHEYQCIRKTKLSDRVIISVLVVIITLIVIAIIIISSSGLV